MSTLQPPRYFPLLFCQQMEANTFPSIESFIIRFVLDETTPAENARPRYRGKVCHNQSDDELVFHAWEDVVEFLKR